MINLNTKNTKNTKNDFELDTKDIVIPLLYSNVDYLLAKKEGQNFNDFIEKEDKINLVVSMIKSEEKSKYSFLEIAEEILPKESEDVFVLIDNGGDRFRFLICNRVSMYDTKSLAKPIEYYELKSSDTYKIAKSNNFNEFKEKINTAIAYFKSDETKKIYIVSNIDLDFINEKEKMLQIDNSTFDAIFSATTSGGLSKKIKPLEDSKVTTGRMAKVFSTIGIVVVLYAFIVPSYVDGKISEQRRIYNKEKKALKRMEEKISNYKKNEYADIKRRLAEDKKVCK